MPNSASPEPIPTAPDAELYPFWSHDIVRFSDVDRYRHINNVAIATYCETGRVAFAEHTRPGSTAGEGVGWVILKLILTFKAQSHYPGEVAIGTRVTRIGRSSCDIDQGLFKDGVCFATSQAVVVWVDLANGGKSEPIPDELVQTLRRMSGPVPAAG